MDKVFGVIYQITNQINGKIYIGQTVSDLRHRFSQHKCGSGGENKSSIRLYNAIQKYGKDNFTIAPIYSAFDSDELNKAEISLIVLHGSQHRDVGYNSQAGGGHTNFGRKWSTETKLKQSLAKKGKVSNRKGTTQTRETKILISLSKDVTNGLYGFSVVDGTTIYARSPFFVVEAGFNQRKITDAIKTSVRFHKGFLWYTGNEKMQNVDQDVANYIASKKNYKSQIPKENQ